jgi:predicted DNA binding CopG/RHH family protein
MKTIQKFSKEYLEHCKSMKPEQIVRFLDDFRRLHGATKEDPMRLISMKIPESLLNAFKLKSQASGLRYQTQIKVLMKEWLKT